MSTAIKHDPVTQIVFDKINAGVEKINDYNKVALTEETGTKVSDIDKVLKDEAAEVPDKVRVLWTEAQESYKVYREKVEAARNGYRVEVLGEDAKETSEISKEETEALKEIRQGVMSSINFLEGYAKDNKNTALLQWLSGLQIPMVGRQGTSTAGQKKPRVHVHVSSKNAEGEWVEKLHENFTKAALALTNKNNKITGADLAQAWADADEIVDTPFEVVFGEGDTAETHVFRIVPKETAKK